MSRLELYFNGNIYTLEREGNRVEAVLVNEGKIIKVGTYSELKNMNSERIDLNGATMIPGLVDSHIHLIGLGEKLSRIQLGHVKSKEEMLEVIHHASKQLAENEWLIAEGWNEYLLPNQEMITLEELDRATNGPAILHRVCHHALMANSRAMNLADISDAMPNPQGGKIGRDKNNRLNGLFYDEATNLITELLSTEGEQYRSYLRNVLNHAIEHMHQLGIVGAHSEDCSYYGHFSNVIDAYRQTVAQKKNFRAHLLRHHKVFEEMIEADLQEVAGFLEFGAMKIFADGSFGASTAALLDPYVNEGDNKGLLLHEEEKFEALVQLARKHNEAIAVHMIGDAACQQVLNTIQKYPASNGKRDRLIHACLVNEAQIEQMKSLPIVIDIQPGFVPSDFPWIAQKLGENRMRYAYAWKTLSQFPLSIGTDAPIEDVNPFKTIAAAVNRDSYGMQQYNEYLSIYEVLKMYTHGSAYAIGKAHERGLIKEGYVADFTILNEDIFALPSEQIEQISTNMTIVDGKIVYKM